MESIESFVTGALADACQRDRASLTLETRLEDVDLDSMSVALFVTLVEAEYGVEMPAERIVELYEAETIRSAAGVVSRLVGVQS
jgi:acyl carrier protein